MRRTEATSAIGSAPLHSDSLLLLLLLTVAVAVMVMLLPTPASAHPVGRSAAEPEGIRSDGLTNLVRNGPRRERQKSVKDAVGILPVTPRKR